MDLRDCLAWGRDQVLTNLATLFFSCANLTIEQILEKWYYISSFSVLK